MVPLIGRGAQLSPALGTYAREAYKYSIKAILLLGAGVINCDITLRRGLARRTHFNIARRKAAPG